MIPSMAAPTITAAILVIGDEILSGRTKDKNIGHIAEYLTGSASMSGRCGSSRRRRRNRRCGQRPAGRYTYLFTTGGIGPTHDDITADCIAQAFGVPIDVDERAVAMMLERYKREDLNEARLPHGAHPARRGPHRQPDLARPGVPADNVIVMAGVPSIMQAMLDNVAGTLETGTRMTSRHRRGGLPEGSTPPALGDRQAGGVSIGSYPSFGRRFSQPDRGAGQRREAPSRRRRDASRCSSSGRPPA
jgi:molybdopterin-biosynthesis enzyme MoeA-like protein